MPDPETIIKPGQFSMGIPGQISAEIDTLRLSRGSGVGIGRCTSEAKISLTIWHASG
jgi:hypothetical protein